MIPSPRLEALLAVELRAARLEGLLAADPPLGRLWRAQTALGEACRSTSLEDIAVFEGDVIARPFESRATDPEAARGLGIATALLQVLARPGDLLRDGPAALQRAWQAGAAGEDPLRPDEGGPEGPPDFTALAARIAGALEDAPGVALGALAAAGLARELTGARAPMFERLVMVQADHSLRRGSMRKGQAASGEDAVDILPEMEGAWVLRPGAALSGSGFRIWAPLSPAGQGDLLAGLAADLDRGLGAVAPLRAWRARAWRAAEGRHGRSRLKDAVAWLEKAPIVTTRSLRDGAGLSDRGALYIIEEMAREGLVEPITGRRTWRAWAIPPVAALLRRRAVRRADFSAATPRTGVPDRPEAKPRAPLEPRAAWEAGLAPLQDALDAAMAEADAVLARWKKPD